MLRASRRLGCSARRGLVGPTRSLSAAAEASGWGPVTAAAGALETLHSATGLPWWLSLALGTLCARTALVPLAVQQARAGAGLAASLAAARSRGVDMRSPRALAAFLRSERAGGGVVPPHPAWTLAAPLAQLPVLVTGLMAVRRLALQPGLGLEEGGAAWVVDLTLPAVDLGALEAPLGPWGAALPALSAAIMFLNLQLSLGVVAGRDAPPLLRERPTRPSRLPALTPLAGHYKLAAEWLMVPMLIAGLTLPQAVFAYW